ncbi:MAG: iron ABC transporter permease [Desulfovibrionaceae bacterium]|nr:iron ABC transporter permease [Desulfovibrionaceae bacterium]
MSKPTPLPAPIPHPQRPSRRRLAVLPALFVLWLSSVPLACLFGPAPLDAGDVLRALLGMGGDTAAMPAEAARMVVTDIRLARTALALLVGGSLAVAGVAMQGVLHNPLAEPFLLGVSSGAALGAGLALCSESALALAGQWSTAHGAMMGAFLALGLSLALGRGGGRDRLILAGVAVSTMFGAGVSLLKALDEESVSGIVFWIMGSFQGRGWHELPLALIPSLLGLVLLVPHWRTLDVLIMGDEDAAHLGVNVRRARLMALIGAGCLTAGGVAVSGIIGFVGLVAPHILRRLMGPWHGPLLAAAWLVGGVFLLWADVAARCVLPYGQELPVGVITALVGGPFFALVLCAGTRSGARP